MTERQSSNDTNQTNPSDTNPDRLRIDRRQIKHDAKPSLYRQKNDKCWNFPLLLSWLVLVLDYEEGLQLPVAAKTKVKQQNKIHDKTQWKGDGYNGPAKKSKNHRKYNPIMTPKQKSNHSWNNPEKSDREQ